MWKAQVSYTVGICWHLYIYIYGYLQWITRSSDFSFTNLWSSEEYNFIRIIGARVFAAIDGKVYCRRLISETSASPDINIAVVGDLLLSELLAYLIVSRSHARGTPSHHAVHHEPLYTIIDLYSFTWRKLQEDLTLSNVRVFIRTKKKWASLQRRSLSKTNFSFYIQTPYT